jgi:DNA-binding transcriptional MocR family regulator
MTDLTQYRIRASNAAELVRGIEDAVASGALAPGQRLPSVRRLAADLELSPVTVSAATAELRRRGVVVTEPRRGTRIGSGPPIGSLRAPMPVPAGARDLSRGNPDPALLPDLGAALARMHLPGRLYGERPMLERFEAAAREQLRSDGIAADAVCVVSGALDGIERVLAAHLRAGDRVAVESPGYAALYDLLRALGLGLEPVAVDEHGMLPAALAAALAAGARAVVLTPRGHNPTGAALDAERAASLARVLAGEPGVLVIEDDHLGQLAGPGLHSVLSGPADAHRSDASGQVRPERWALARSVAKALGPDLRVAIVAADEHTVARVQGRQQCGPGWVSHLLQALVLELWSDPRLPAALEHARETYARRREGLIAALGERGVAAYGRSGLNVWVPVQDEAGVHAAMLARGWVLAPGAPYRLGAAPAAVRVTIATLEHEEAQRLANDLAAALAPGRWARSG